MGFRQLVSRYSGVKCYTDDTLRVHRPSNDLAGTPRPRTYPQHTTTPPGEGRRGPPGRPGGRTIDPPTKVVVTLDRYVKTADMRVSPHFIFK